MRFNISYNTGKTHAELVSAVSWEGGVLVSGSDDQTVQRWSGSGQHETQVDDDIECLEFSRFDNTASTFTRRCVH